MSDRCFFDTNVIVYLFDSSETIKHAKAKDLLSLLEQKELCVSIQVINEFISIVTGKIENTISFDDIEGVIDFLRSRFIIFPLSETTTLGSIPLKKKYQYSFWDSLLISSALENNCIVIYTEDMHHDQIIENSLKIVNPFK